MACAAAAVDVVGTRRARRDPPRLEHARRILARAARGEPFSADDLLGLPLRLRLQVFAELAPSIQKAGRSLVTALAGEAAWRTGRRAGVAAGAGRADCAGCASSVAGGGADVVTPLLGDRHPEVRAEAAAWACEHPSPHVVDPLVGLLADPHPRCRFTAKDALLRVGGAAVAPVARRLARPSGPGGSRRLRRRRRAPCFRLVRGLAGANLPVSETALWLLARFEWLVLGYFVVVNAFPTLLLAAAQWELRHHALTVWAEGRHRLLSSPVAPGVSVLAPAYKEESSVGQSVRRCGARAVPLRSASAARRPRQAQRRQGRRLERRPERGAGALVCALDADTLVEPDALLPMVRLFLTDDRVVAAGGTVRVANGSSVRAGRVIRARAPRQPMATCRRSSTCAPSCSGGRAGTGWAAPWSSPAPSTCSVATPCSWRAGTPTTRSVRTWSSSSASASRHRPRGTEPGRLRADPVAGTEAPGSLRTLGRQRDRWHRGLADVLWRHRAVVGRPRYGGFGVVATPYQLFVELLGPVAEALGLLGLAVALLAGGVDPEFGALFFLVAYGWGIVLSVTAVLFEQVAFRRYPAARDRVLLVLWSLVENLGYRQLSVVWRLRGMYRSLRRRTDWGAMVRRGSDVAAEGRRRAPGAGTPRREGGGQ